jgi:hypothetical protein
MRSSTEILEYNASFTMCLIPQDGQWNFKGTEKA